MANAINWFEIPVNDLDRAKKFYESSFDVSLEPLNMPNMEMAMFPVDNEAKGTAPGALIKAETYTPSYSGSVVYFTVDSIEGTLDKINSIGGKTLNPKMEIGENGFVAHFEDCEGNRVALHSFQ